MVAFERILEDTLDQAVARKHIERGRVANDLSDWLLKYRNSHHLTQNQLAERMGCSQPVIARLELGDYEPRLSTLRNLAKVLGVTFHITIDPNGTSTDIDPD